MRRFRLALTGLLAYALTATLGPAAAPATGPRPVIPVVTCAGVRTPGVVVQSAVVEGRYCQLRGVLAGSGVTVAVRLPVYGWSGRYVQAGCGGLCGEAVIAYPGAAGCVPLGEGVVAGAATDMGHQGTSGAGWADHDPRAQTDFGYAAVHGTAVAAKALITAYYGRPPAHSYFDGCSDGGREALMEAQRFPGDFDGVVAGAPANDIAVQNVVHHPWSVLANLGADGRPILLAGRLPMLHAAVLAACDSLDGRRDGVLDDPRRCDFDPGRLVCRTGGTLCLSAAQAAAVRRLHDGAVDADGLRLEPAVAHEWGSELGWTLFVPATADGRTQAEGYALRYLRHLARPDRPRPAFTLADVRFTRLSFRDEVLPSTRLLAALDPRLGPFRARGGRLIVWHGWADQSVAPASTFAYWQAVRSTMGAAAVDAFARLYVLPGVPHCGGGFDVLTPLMDWVEQGRAPGAVDLLGRGVAPTTEVPADQGWLGADLFHG